MYKYIWRRGLHITKNPLSHGVEHPPGHWVGNRELEGASNWLHKALNVDYEDEEKWMFIVANTELSGMLLKERVALLNVIVSKGKELNVLRKWN